MTEDEMNLDMLVAELEQENRLLRARNERLMAEAQASNFERTAAWLKACGKVPAPAAMAVQIGCDFEEKAEFFSCIELDDGHDRSIQDRLRNIVHELNSLGHLLKKGLITASIPKGRRAEALDAICDSEVTGNGVAYLAGFDKRGADQAVLASNDAKLVDGKPVILPGGKIGKPEGWKAPDLSGFV
jgi:hypothetical protein